MVQDNETINKFAGVLKELPEFELSPADTAFIIIDMQYLDAHRDYGMGAEAKALGTSEHYDYFFTRIDELLIPNIQRVQKACREHGESTALQQRRAGKIASRNRRPGEDRPTHR